MVKAARGNSPSGALRWGPTLAGGGWRPETRRGSKTWSAAGSACTTGLARAALYSTPRRSWSTSAASSAQSTGPRRRTPAWSCATRNLSPGKPPAAGPLEREHDQHDARRDQPTLLVGVEVHHWVVPRPSITR